MQAAQAANTLNWALHLIQQQKAQASPVIIECLQKALNELNETL